MNNLLNKNEALEAVIRELSLNINDTRLISIRFDGTHYEVILRSSLMEYDCFVGGVSGDVCGIDARPCLDTEDSDSDQLSVYNLAMAA